ncbi:glycosyltransferase family 69 protein [Lophiostoma macrostomum CBS 122681]|uniref:Glycosyltransferase family 69 protein n=1 Tax=Lophiostoma macrostomum CBS 122681 TaxID=1314788 RepID=A0A6A6T281_9PLEO|nr:glycosyltransferase family 69 protein [Lophiostoma macrostomum CBS 122681]
MIGRFAAQAPLLACCLVYCRSLSAIDLYGPWALFSITLMSYSYLRLRIRRWLRHPALRLLLIVLIVLDTVHVLHIASRQHAASLQKPPRNTKRIYIASQHWNTAQVLRDRWNDALVNLVQQLGSENVFISIFESGSYDDTKDALRELDEALGELKVERSIILSDVSHKDEIEKQPTEHGWIKTPAGDTELRRIPFLSNLRNEVLKPLHVRSESGERFDTILFLNDVVFSTIDVLNLLDTNGGSYAAACSLDFANWPYYYDTFALRDSSGHETVSQTWPYFRSSASRYAMEHFEPVPVASCWNGMVAMPAEAFLGKDPLRFRGISDSLAASHLEGSECCLIHADNPASATKGVWMNPNVRVGYNVMAYEKANLRHATMSTLEMYTSIWYNRILRWATTPVFKEWTVEKRVKKWKAKTKGQEPGVYCLINEMQVIFERGWKHV